MKPKKFLIIFFLEVKKYFEMQNKIKNGSNG